MKNILTIFLIAISTISFSQENCKEYKENYIPKNLKGAIKYLDCTWSESDKILYKNKKERKAVTDLHFGTGMHIRNGWNLWKGRNRISIFFRFRGISHPDDMSGIILTSFHRHLNNKPIKLKEQIKSYEKYWNALKNVDKIAKQNFKKIKNGETIKIPFSSCSGWRYDGTDRTTLFGYTKYSFPSPKEIDCLVIGSVLKKEKKKGEKLLIIKIIQCDCSNLRNPIYNNKNVSVGETMTINTSRKKVIFE